MSKTFANRQPGSPEPVADELYSAKQAAAYIGCSVGYLTKIRGAGTGPKFHRLFERKGIRYSRHDIDRWTAARRFGSTSEYPTTHP